MNEEDRLATVDIIMGLYMGLRAEPEAMGFDNNPEDIARFHRLYAALPNVVADQIQYQGALDTFLAKHLDELYAHAFSAAQGGAS